MTKELKNRIISNAVLIGFAAVISKFVGVLRDRLLASHFGASTTLDAYFTAFRLPDFIFNLIVLGAVSAAFVPVFVHYLEEKKIKEASMIAASVLNALIILLGIFAVLGMIFVRPLTNIIGYGYTPGSDAFELTAQFTRIMLLSPVLLGASSVVSGILNSHQRFLAYSIAPILYNLGIIVGIIFFVPVLGPLGLAWGVVVGAILHLASQMPALIRVGFRWKPIINLKHKAVRQISRLMLPRIFGAAALQISLLITTALATTLSEGSVSVYNLANNIQAFPVTIFGISLSIATFPILAQAAAKQDQKAFRENFSSTFRKILFLIIPSSILLILLRAQVVRLLLGTGQFDWNDTIATLDTLAYFTLSLFSQALIPLLARTFYALQDTRTPVIFSLIGMTINITLALILVKHIGVVGLALSFSIANFVEASLLVVALRTKFGSLDDAHIVRSTMKILLSSILAGVGGYATLYLMAAFLNTHTVLGLALQAGAAGVVGVLIYLTSEYLLRSEELHYFLAALRDRKKHRAAAQNIVGPTEPGEGL